MFVLFARAATDNVAVRISFIWVSPNPGRESDTDGLCPSNDLMLVFYNNYGNTKRDALGIATQSILNNSG
jgi:hypothetical protein